MLLSDKSRSRLLEKEEMAWTMNGVGRERSDGAEERGMLGGWPGESEGERVVPSSVAMQGEVAPIARSPEWPVSLSLGTSYTAPLSFSGWIMSLSHSQAHSDSCMHSCIHLCTHACLDWDLNDVR